MPEKKFKFFTGLTQYHFNVLFDLIGGEEGIRQITYVYGQKTPRRTLDHRKFSSKNRLFMMLIRMRRGVPIIDLAHIFGIGKTQCGVICYAMIRVTYEYLYLLQPHMFMSAEQQKKNMPLPFMRFKNLRVIIDCQQGNTFSSYKHGNTEKYLIGTSGYGSVIFCSDGFEGNKSDKEILKASGIMNYLEKGDSVMADRGFNVKTELAEIGVNLIKPPDFKKKRQCLNPQEEILTKDTATARIYVEHVMKSIKDWRILRNTVPMSVHDILPDMEHIVAWGG
ncbi:uncharacterized protein LOC127750446 [Frankliniella occidentalis]|uniref:Uncharacterized protein LOC127750446 n=1 Tax=Frankliniella occidentalis TaxID=133901 RepID=A0A9C6X2X3_FRAOC|nr:uncharacterized protein LOC127750446 [Frankliniella occidentalis]